MKICFAVSSAEGLASRIDAIRPDVRYLLIFDQDTRAAVDVDLGSEVAQDAAASDFDALVCATITRPLFRALRQQGKAVYLTQAPTVEAAVAEFEAGQMLLIPDEAGGCAHGGCAGHGHAQGEGGCGCHGDGDGATPGGCGGHDHASGGGGCGGHDHAHGEGGCGGNGHAHGEGACGCHGQSGEAGHAHGGCGGGGCGGHGHDHGKATGGGCCASRHAGGHAQPRARGENLRVAVTSQNRKTVTEHAGKCRKFWIYETRAGRVTGKTLLELPIEQSLHETPAGAPHPLDGVDVLITAGIGDGLRQRLGSRGIDTRVTSEQNPDAAVEAFIAAL
jgi:predicted Fe-Mo cluster-binding NifX family protein